jgi:cullin 3
MGTADIRAHFPRTKSSNKFRELNVSTYAMIVLLLFNDLDPPDSSLTVEEIQAKTNIPLHDLTRNLQSLAVASKTRVLTKEPHSREIKPGDRFFFNEEFYSQYTKIKIGVVANSHTNRPEDAAEREQTEKKNNDARAAIIEAAIVRIMKFVFFPPFSTLSSQTLPNTDFLLKRQRKQLVHSHLITEVISQLNSRFMPDVGMVKKRIESLIEREYLERVEDSNWPEYRYLA